jgi:hypothetical protein
MVSEIEETMGVAGVVEGLRAGGFCVGSGVSSGGEEGGDVDYWEAWCWRGRHFLFYCLPSGVFRWGEYAMR